MASRMAAVVLQVLQPATALLIVVTNQSHTLFSFHPPLMATAFLGFIGQGVLTSLAVRGLEGEKRGQLLIRHALWQVSGLLTMVLGIWAAYASKEIRGAPHFGALHAKLGLLTVALSTTAAVGGALAFGKTGLLQLFPAHLQPQIKTAHRTAGLVTVLLGAVVIELGLQLKTAHQGTLTLAVQGSVALCAALLAFLALQPYTATATKKLS